jgi:predicted AAA+ superfamily ATPase
MIRKHYLDATSALFKQFPVVALLGPRQAGKTTLARQLAETWPWPRPHLFDLENPTHLSRLDNAKLALESLEGLIVIDEVQLRPELFPVLRVLVDEPSNKRHFLILGSASRDLIRQSSETLAGRIAYVELSPFQRSEVDDQTKHWIRGGFPRSYLANSDEESHLWRENYIRTYLERDLPQLGIQIPAAQMRRFWMMLAHYHGQIFNAAEIGRSMSINEKTARKYLDILSATFMTRTLQPWYENVGKRQVKSPKIYFRDSGVFHSLLGLQNEEQLRNHPKLGASWEGYALEQTILKLEALPEEVFFWATHGNAEIDLFVVRGGKRLGLEFKYTDQPKITPSLSKAMKLLKLDEAVIIYPGAERFALAENISAAPL